MKKKQLRTLTVKTMLNQSEFDDMALCMECANQVAQSNYLRSLILMDARTRLEKFGNFKNPAKKP